MRWSYSSSNARSASVSFCPEAYRYSSIWWKSLIDTTRPLTCGFDSTHLNAAWLNACLPATKFSSTVARAPLRVFIATTPDPARVRVAEDVGQVWPVLEVVGDEQRLE